MKTPKDFYILLPVETVSREIDYKLYLSVMLAKKGFKIFLGKKDEIYSLFQNLNSSFAYIDKGFHENLSLEKIYKVIIKTEVNQNIKELETFLKFFQKALFI